MRLELYDISGAKVADLSDDSRPFGFFSPQDGCVDLPPFFSVLLILFVLLSLFDLIKPWLHLCPFPSNWRYRIHVVDLDPSSVTSGGWLEDTSLVEKYTISEEAYNKLDGKSFFKTPCLFGVWTLPVVYSYSGAGCLLVLEKEMNLSIIQMLFLESSISAVWVVFFTVFYEYPEIFSGIKSWINLPSSIRILPITSGLRKLFINVCFLLLFFTLLSFLKVFWACLISVQ